MLLQIRGSLSLCFTLSLNLSGIFFALRLSRPIFLRPGRSKTNLQLVVLLQARAELKGCSGSLNITMQFLPQKVTTLVPPMSIENSKVEHLRISTRTVRRPAFSRFWPGTT